MMRADGVHRNALVVRHIGVAAAARQQLQDVGFAGGQHG
jgi:hypothetical protein